MKAIKILRAVAFSLYYSKRLPRLATLTRVLIQLKRLFPCYFGDDYWTKSLSFLLLVVFRLLNYIGLLILVFEHWLIPINQSMTFRVNWQQMLVITSVISVATLYWLEGEFEEKSTITLPLLPAKLHSCRSELLSRSLNSFKLLFMEYFGFTQVLTPSKFSIPLWCSINRWI